MGDPASLKLPPSPKGYGGQVAAARGQAGVNSLRVNSLGRGFSSKHSGDGAVIREILKKFVGSGIFC